MKTFSGLIVSLSRSASSLSPGLPPSGRLVLVSGDWKLSLVYCLSSSFCQLSMTGAARAVATDANAPAVLGYCGAAGTIAVGVSHCSGSASVGGGGGGGGFSAVGMFAPFLSCRPSRPLRVFGYFRLNLYQETDFE